jgi:thiol-disulfide isomerase/thioredoxin
MRLLLVLVIVVSVAVIVERARRPSAEELLPVGPASRVLAKTGETERRLMAVLDAETDLDRNLDGAASDAQRREILADFMGNRPAMRDLLECVKNSPHDPMAIASLSRIIHHYPDADESKDAAALLVRDHLRDESLSSVLVELERSESWPGIEVLRSIHESSPHPAVRLQAGYRLACLLTTKAEREGWSNPSAAGALFGEAERLFQETARDDGGLRGDGRVPLGDLARAHLDEIHGLIVGKAAPEIDGEDVDGHRMRLSDYRGKVVVLSFWGDWCSLCRSMYGLERSLVEEMQGRPFVMLGVNSDNEVSTPQGLLSEKMINWRSWKDGGEVYGGVIAARWNVRDLPDFFIIDAKGVIRHHVGPHADDHDRVYNLDAAGRLTHRWRARSEQVKEVVEALVREAEQPDSPET